MPTTVGKAVVESNMFDILITLLVSQVSEPVMVVSETALPNILSSVTLVLFVPIFQPVVSRLTSLLALLNIYDMVVTLDTSQDVPCVCRSSVVSPGAVVPALWNIRNRLVTLVVSQSAIPMTCCNELASRNICDKLLAVAFKPGAHPVAFSVLSLFA